MTHDTDPTGEDTREEEQAEEAGIGGGDDRWIWPTKVQGF